MPDLVLIDGDVVTFLPVFGAAIVAALPGRISGSGPANASVAAGQDDDFPRDACAARSVGN